jgi:hypothetical protein
VKGVHAFLNEVGIPQKYVDCALNAAVEQMKDGQSIDELFEICRQLMTYMQKHKLPSRRELMHYCCFYGNSSLLQQMFIQESSRWYEHGCLTKGTHARWSIGKVALRPLSFALLKDHKECVRVIANYFRSMRIKNIKHVKSNGKRALN